MKDLVETIHAFRSVGNLFMTRFLGFGASQLKARDRLRSEFNEFTHKGRRAIVKRLSDNYLEWNFAIASTVRDLEDAGFGLWRSYARTLQGIPHQHVSGVAFTTTLRNSNTAIAPGNAYGPAECNVGVYGILTEDLSVRYHGAVRIYSSTRNSGDDKPVIARSAVQELGLNLSNWLPTLWECIPYSFVVDYFTNAGQMINAVSFLDADVLWVERSVRNTANLLHVFDRKIDKFLSANRPTVRDQFHYDPTLVTSKYWTRDKFSGSLVPPFRLHLPYRAQDWLTQLALLGARL
jgi:hypothetical protein